MGAGMAANLLKAGNDVTVYNRTRSKVEALVAGSESSDQRVGGLPGRRRHDHAGQRRCSQSVVFGDDGIIGNLRQGAIHVSSSTISVTLSERLEAAHAKRDSVSWQRRCSVVLTPLRGQLVVAAAGAPGAVKAVSPLLDAIENIFVAAETAKIANLVKLSGNFLLASVIESLGEAMALVGKAGVDRRRYINFLTSTLFDVPVYRTYGGLIADRKFEPAGFAAPLGHKDIRLALAAAEDLRVPMPFASLLHDRFLTLLAHGGDNLDWPAIGGLAAKDAGEVDG
jgi:3-hydroxyisobutyrate dehydrogenase-like beta-hydroxyacid dehydrogenase